MPGQLIEKRHRPGAVPLKYHRDPKRGFSLLYPESWHRFEMQLAEGEGVLFSASPEDLATHISVEVRDLGTLVTADDLPTLRTGFLKGLRAVPGSRLQRRQDYDNGFFIGLETRQTYLDDGVARKRWVRLLYKGSMQVRLVAQGSSPEVFDYWLPVFNPAMTAFFFDGGIAPAPQSEGDWLDAVSASGGKRAS